MFLVTLFTWGNTVTLTTTTTKRHIPGVKYWNHERKMVNGNTGIWVGESLLNVNVCVCARANHQTALPYQ